MNKENKEERWYCSSYYCIDRKGNVELDINPDSDFFIAENDEDAIKQAKELASKGVDYADCGHFDLELIAVTRVDPNLEWEDVETIWF